MSEIRRVLQKVREGKLKRLITELLWMYAYVRKYWLLIGVYILLGASGSVLSLGTSVVSRDLVDAVTGVNSAEIIRGCGCLCGRRRITDFYQCCENKFITESPAEGHKRDPERHLSADPSDELGIPGEIPVW